MRRNRRSCLSYAPRVSLVGGHVPAGLGVQGGQRRLRRHAQALPLPATRGERQAASHSLRQRRAVLTGAGGAWGAHSRQLLGGEHGCRGGEEGGAELRKVSRQASHAGSSTHLGAHHAAALSGPLLFATAPSPMLPALPPHKLSTWQGRQARRLGGRGGPLPIHNRCRGGDSRRGDEGGGGRQLSARSGCCHWRAHAGLAAAGRRVQRLDGERLAVRLPRPSLCCNKGRRQGLWPLR